jgi:fructose-1,6-bisphosphatase/sedoheptulose 1,7-bisphosphatase-like protein
MLSIGESIGNGNPPHVDVAVSLVDGMALIANGLNTLKDDLEIGDGAATDE